MAQGVKGKKEMNSVEAVAEQAVPMGDDFFEMDINPKQSSEMQQNASTKQQFYL
jgi:hypothetical protein